MEKYSTMRAIGAEIGMTSHQVGKLLKKLGLRDDKGQPTADAKHLTKEVPSTNPGTWNYVWDEEKVIELFRKMAYIV